MNKSKEKARLYLSCLFIISFTICSCSHVDFESSGSTPFKISAEKNSDESVEVEGTADFYFWGQSPSEMKVDLEDFETKLGMTRPSFVSIEQTWRPMSVFLTFVTLGLYSPVDYKVKMLKVTGASK